MSAPHNLDAHRAYGQMLVEVAALVATIEREGLGQHGDPLLAVCLDCQPVLPTPFGGVNRVAAWDDRQAWVDTHRAGTGHRIVRPEYLSADLVRIAAKRNWGGE